ncbi:MAG: glycosyltransferase family 39 protein [Patescibacteria group bacterium]
MQKANIIFWTVSVVGYLTTRTVNLDVIPIFTDEAIYSYWAQVALHDPANRFISLEDGKQPLFIWLAAIFQKFISDPLIATRLVSVMSGLGSIIGIFLLAKTLFGEKVAKTAMVLYIILPFTLLYDRLALFDSLLTMLGIYSVLFTVKLVTVPKLENSFLLGVSTGFAMITKSSGNFFLYLIPASALLQGTWSKLKFNLKEIFRWAGYVLLAVAIANIIYNSLRLSPLFYIIARKNLGFIRPVAEVIIDPFSLFIPNFTTLTGWLIVWIGPVLFIIFILATIRGILQKNFKVIYLAIVTLAPFGAETVFNKVLYPRFMLFYFPYVIILIAYGSLDLLEKLKINKKLLTLLFILVLIYPTINSFWLIAKPTNAKIPSSDAGQYLNDWPAGYGVAEIVSFLKNQPTDVDIYIGTEGTFGLLPYALQIYFFGQKNIHIIGFWPVNADDLPEQILDLSKKGPTYFVFNENQKDINSPKLKLIEKYQKGVGASYMRLYQVVPQ